ncbi:MAG: hypothetical protein ACXVRZ_11905 [Gaiellaceae bacterium]
MGLLDKAKAAAEQAAAKAKEGVDDVQTKRELGQAYNDLGKTAYELIVGGDIADPRLEEGAQKIRTLRERVEGGGAPPAPESYDSSQPPAMPT